jgi:threonine/homoserine/homoserine lactone efflux protein
MDRNALLIFAGALLVAAAAPGPGVLALVARVIASGLGGIAPFLAGLILTDLIWLAAAMLGLAVLAQTFHQVFVAVKFIGAGYLLYLAFRIWIAPVKSPAIDAAVPRRSAASWFFAGLSVNLGNPKVVSFYLALLPSLIDLSRAGLLGYAKLAAACVVVLTLVLGTYTLAAARARRLLANTRAMRLLNRVGGALMAGAAVAVATK